MIENPVNVDLPKADPPKRKRRWLQFSLRTLMIVVPLLAAACGYWRLTGADHAKYA